VEVAERIVQYRFEPETGKHYGSNLTALLDEENGRSLLIDTAYEAQAAEAYADLTNRGFELAAVIVSHFHPDHVMGLKALPQMTVYGSGRCKETLRLYPDEDERRAISPTDPVDDGAQVSFGPFDLAFRFAPGHSACSMYTLIGDDFLHVADNIMTSDAGQDVLPWAAYDLIEDHIRSLEALRPLCERTLLLSHGIVLDDSETIHAAIDNRVAYFRAVLAGDGRIPYEEAVAGCSCDFLHREWLIRRDDST
jgi:glyoxylase-like metal-dependent hydrolase (beta-lactamase superfamily II)